MNKNENGPAGRDDDKVVAEPKGGGMDRPGAAKDDDKVVAEPKGGGMERPGC